MDAATETCRSGRLCARCAFRPVAGPAGPGGDTSCPFAPLAEPLRQLARGERLHACGDEVSGVALVVDGTLKSVSNAPDGEEQVLAFHLPGELIGLDALATGRYRSDVVALAPAVIRRFPIDSLFSKATPRASAEDRLSRAIGETAARAQPQIELLLRRQASERIALFLGGLLGRMQPPGESLVELTLPMSRDDIARHVGLALETVSRGLTRLQDDGVIRVLGRHVEIRDPDVLARLAGRA
ncbi:MAG: fumarate/nitrate reduction transcriptional regulator Fnr [Pseudomonadota bacterium]|jgi:CRP/FNR family transcriptional regulator